MAFIPYRLPRPGFPSSTSRNRRRLAGLRLVDRHAECLCGGLERGVEWWELRTPSRMAISSQAASYAWPRACSRARPMVSDHARASVELSTTIGSPARYDSHCVVSAWEHRLRPLARRVAGRW